MSKSSSEMALVAISRLARVGIILRQLRLALRALMLRLGVVEFRLIRPRIDREQEVALLHLLAFLEMNLVEITADARAISTVSGDSSRPMYSSHSTISFAQAAPRKRPGESEPRAAVFCRHAANSEPCNDQGEYRGRQFNNVLENGPFILLKMPRSKSKAVTAELRRTPHRVGPCAAGARVRWFEPQPAISRACAALARTSSRARRSRQTLSPATIRGSTGIGRRSVRVRIHPAA